MNSIKNKTILLGMLPFLIMSCAFSKTADEMSKSKKDSSKAKSWSGEEASKNLSQNLSDSNQAEGKNQLLNRSLANQEIEVSNSSGLVCFALYTDEFSSSYIRIGNKSDLDANLFIGFNSVLKSYCEEDKKTLIQYYCDPEKEDLVSAKKIVCKNSCVSGACTR